MDKKYDNYINAENIKALAKSIELILEEANPLDAKGRDFAYEYYRSEYNTLWHYLLMIRDNAEAIINQSL